MNDARRALIILAKHPECGDVKTRLKPELNSSQIAELYGSMIKDTFDLVKKYEFIKIFFFIWPAEYINRFKKYHAERIITQAQEGSNLGQRMFNSINDIFKKGFHQIAVISVDSPNLPDHIIPAAFQLLDENDIVLGPADDGGYYLIALKRVQPSLFEDIEWSSEKVFRQTVIKAVKLGCDVGLLPEWYDIDTYENLLKLKKDLEERTIINQHIPEKTLSFIKKNIK